MKDYTALKKQYPNPISLDEMSRVCKIAKRTARYLVEHGIIPAIDTGKITWRYQIAIDDVITYLYRRDKVGSMIPPGAVTSRYKNRTINITRKSFSQMITQGQEWEIAEYFKYIYAADDEILTTADVADMTGLSNNTIIKLARDGYIKALTDTPQYLFPKQYLLEFVVTPRFIEIKSNSKVFKKILGGFEIWKTAKSSQ